MQKKLSDIWQLMGSQVEFPTASMTQQKGEGFVRKRTPVVTSKVN